MSKTIPIGICQTPDRLPEVAAGYDYVELSVMGTLTPLVPDDAFDMLALEHLSLPVRANNSFVPPQVRVVGPDVDWDQVTAYAATGFARASHLGSKLIVFGSGGARMVPEDYSRALAWGQIVRFLNECADLAAEHGIIVAIEPLNHTECNILNTYTESVQMARDVDRDEIRVLADIYHFERDHEPLEDILRAPEWLAHVHLADTGRLYPGSGSYPLPRLFDILHDLDYAGCASVECTWGHDLAGESAAALGFLKKLAAAR